MSREDLSRYEMLAIASGFEVTAQRYAASYFDSWTIDLSRAGYPDQRLTWDGKDRTLSVETSDGEGWFLRWFGAVDDAGAALTHLAEPVTAEWIAERRREREEGWAKFFFQQALSTAAPFWEQRRYADYVKVLSPFREQLSPAQTKRLDLAKRRAKGS